MKISHAWLREYVPHELSPEELAERLTMLGLEVESVERLDVTTDGVVVGQVDTVRDHPNADKLVLCDVDLGDGNGPVQIACGAPNVAAGQKVPVATVGTTVRMPDREDPRKTTPVTIEETKLRGEVSRGMICSEVELGLSEDHSGVLVLDEAAPVGQPFADYLAERSIASDDAVLEIDITPNRPDATSHIGVARDVAAATKATLQRPEVTLPEAGGPAADQVQVEIQSPEACPRYVGLLIRDVEVGESPAWLKRRLSAIGLRPRNNVVDVTNFVMHECGQPLHAFDFDTLAGGQIVVRTAEREEPFVTLDGVQHTVPKGALFICDAERPVALAGIMGGANSEVTDSTTNILIESAYFDPSTIRRTAKALGLSTDSSYRFERGIDAEGQRWAAARAAELITELAGGERVSGIVDAHPKPFTPRTITLRPERANRLLGIELFADEMAELLTALGFSVQVENDVLTCTVPPFRPDVTIEADLIEEVGRLHGYDRIPMPDRAAVPADVPRTLPAHELRSEARALLSGLGFREIYTNSMLPKERADRFNAPEIGGGVAAGPVVETLKPISREMAALRPSLLPGLLEVMQHNWNHGQRVLRFFEFGHVFRRTERPDTVVPGYAEHESFLLGLSGPRARPHWSDPADEADFFDLKGVAQALFRRLQLDVSYEEADAPHPLVTYRLDVLAGEAPLGTLARLADDVAERFDLDAPVFFAELDWSSVVELAETGLTRRYTPVSRFPVVERDLAVLVDENQRVGALLEALRTSGGSLLQAASVFDLYEGEGVPAGKKSVAFSLRFGADRTLTDDEVDQHLEEMLGTLRRRFGAELRQ